jgi:hypothetical protein
MPLGATPLWTKPSPISKACPPSSGSSPSNQPSMYQLTVDSRQPCSRSRRSMASRLLIRPPLSSRDLRLVTVETALSLCGVPSPEAPSSHCRKGETCL